MKSTVNFPRRRALAALGATAAIMIPGGFALDTAGASAQNISAQQQVSQNWSGYVVRSSAGKSFSSVSGSWVEPSASASSGQGDAAFWVGLGGASNQSQALEQVGTAAQVDNGQTTYYAWYELVPAAQVPLNLTIHPGDHISAKVTVDGTKVTISLSDQTTGQSVTKTLQMSNPDTSSAEWIAEAPAAEFADGSTEILPLANFGKVTFTNASATAGGHTGSISDPAWSVGQIGLSSAGGQQFIGGGPAFSQDGLATSPSQSGGATPGGVSDNGSSFTVSYTSDSASAASSSTPTSDSGGYGYSGDGYGYPGYGYGYGYPGYGYGGYFGYGYGVYF